MELIGQFFIERRILTPLPEIPKTLTQAVIATEDAQQLASAMEQIMTSWDSYSAEKIRESTLKQYGEIAVMKKYHELFQQILNQ